MILTNILLKILLYLNICYVKIKKGGFMKEVTIKDFPDEYFNTDYLRQNLNELYQKIVYLSSRLFQL